MTLRITKLLFACILGLFIGCVNASNKNLIIGDSHVGGIKWAVPNAPVMYKNGSTINYWLNVNPIHNIDNLYIMTGTNDYRHNISPKSWYSNTQKLCKKWQPKHCYVVAPPRNSDWRYVEYRKELMDKPNVRWTNTNDKTRDGTHFYRNTYKDFYYQIIINY